MKQYIITLLSLFSFSCLQAQSLEGSFSSLGEEEAVNGSDIQLTAICGQPFEPSGKGDQLAYGFSEIVAATNEANEITGISLDKSSAIIKVDESLQLTATILPEDANNKTVNWKSSNTTIATVSENGLVKAIAKGNATITATTASGMFAAECAITVTSTPQPEPEPVPVTGVTLDQTSATFKVKETITLTATVSPADADNKAISWTSSDEKIAQVDRGVVTAIAPGTAVISVITEDGDFEAKCTVTVEDIDTANEMIQVENKVYPVWIENVLYIELLKAQTIYVVNVSGKIQDTIQGQAGLNTISAESYPAGIYFIRLKDQVVKVIKK